MNQLLQSPITKPVRRIEQSTDKKPNQFSNKRFSDKYDLSRGTRISTPIHSMTPTQLNRQTSQTIKNVPPTVKRTPSGRLLPDISNKSQQKTNNTSKSRIGKKKPQRDSISRKNVTNIRSSPIRNIADEVDTKEYNIESAAIKIQSFIRRILVEKTFKDNNTKEHIILCKSILIPTGSSISTIIWGNTKTLNPQFISVSLGGEMSIISINHSKNDKLEILQRISSTKEINCIRYHYSTNKIITGEEDGVVNLWDSSSCDNIQQIVLSLYI